MYVDVINSASLEHRVLFKPDGSIYGHENVMMLDKEIDLTIRRGMLQVLLQKIKQDPALGSWGAYSWKAA